MGENEVLALEEAAGRRVLSRDPPNAEAAGGAFARLITPASQRFVRCHFPVPRLGGDHRLELGGALVHPRRLSLADLRSLPRATQTVVTECAGNGRSSIAPEVPGEPWRDGAVSTAQWTGVPLLAVLERAGLRETASELVFTGADSAYRRSLPREAALDPAVLLAFEMNGAPIPALFGGPLRLVVPGWYGMASVKWLARIDAVEEPFSGEFQTGKYVYAPGEPVTRIRVKSLFTSVARDLRPGVAARLGGLCWGGDRIARVDVSAGDGWRAARLAGPDLPHAWRRFELDWTPPAPGRYLLRCRATDARGETQPVAPRWNPAGYGANGIHEIAVAVR